MSDRHKQRHRAASLRLPSDRLTVHCVGVRALQAKMVEEAERALAEEVTIFRPVHMGMSFTLLALITLDCGQTDGAEGVRGGRPPG